VNRLRIMLDHYKGFGSSAVLAALFVFLAGGANALAGIRPQAVWTVSKTSSVSTCVYPSATTCNTIGAAVSVAAPGDVILVGPGKYNESVYIDTPDLFLFGAQAGKDARVGRDNQSKESIVDATGQGGGPGGGAGFYVNINNVVIDGFTIQGGTDGAAGSYASGIYAEKDAIQIVNNIIQNNAVGVYLYGWDYGLVQHNLIKTNNTGTPGSNENVIPGPGFGIAVEYYYPVSITENAFEGNLAAAMFFYDLESSEVSYNTSKDDGSFAVFSACGYTDYFSYNQGRDFGAKGFLPAYTDANADAAVDVISDVEVENEYTYGNYGLQIKDNDLEEGKATGYNGIAFSTIAGVPNDSDAVCTYCIVRNNRITQFAGNGIVAEEWGFKGTLFQSMISGNDVTENGHDGILIQSAPNNEYNLLNGNKAGENHVFDCADDTKGPLTLGTYDTWFNDFGGLSYPGRLCIYGSWQD